LRTELVAKRDEPFVIPKVCICYYCICVIVGARWRRFVAVLDTRGQCLRCVQAKAKETISKYHPQYPSLRDHFARDGLSPTRKRSEVKLKQVCSRILRSLLRKLRPARGFLMCLLCRLRPLTHSIGNHWILAGAARPLPCQQCDHRLAHGTADCFTSPAACVDSLVTVRRADKQGVNDDIRLRKCERVLEVLEKEIARDIERETGAYLDSCGYLLRHSHCVLCCVWFSAVRVRIFEVARFESTSKAGAR
jgi:hypothetical protein